MYIQSYESGNLWLCKSRRFSGVTLVLLILRAKAIRRLHISETSVFANINYSSTVIPCCFVHFSACCWINTELLCIYFRVVLFSPCLRFRRHIGWNNTPGRSLRQCHICCVLVTEGVYSIIYARQARNHH